MINHIKNYILENKRVSIRTLGTLELRFREAEIHPICQDFTPPGKYLSFSADENESGEDFCRYVAEKAGVSLENAQQLLAQWVDTVNATLQADGKYELGGMGCFVRGNVGLNFEPALDPELSAESFGLPVFSLIEERTPLFGQKEESPLQKEAEPIAEKPTAIATETKEEAKDTMEETKESTKEAVTEEKDKLAEAQKETSEAREQAETEEEVVAVTQPEKPKRHVGRLVFYVLLILLLCVIIAAGVYAILRPDDFVQKKDACISRVNSLFSRDTNSVDAAVLEETEWDDWYDDTDGESVEDEFQLEETVTEQTDPSAVSSVATAASTEAPAAAKPARCYVIVGGFGNPANADNLVRSLKTKYPNACNLGLNAKGTLTMVGVGPFTRAEAESKADALSVTYKDCWILEK